MTTLLLQYEREGKWFIYCLSVTSIWLAMEQAGLGRNRVAMFLYHI